MGNSLPTGIRRGHRYECPGCGYSGKNLIDHLERKHPDVRERYERSQRGVWVLKDDDGWVETGDGQEEEESGESENKNEEQETVEDLRQELREKEMRVSELEARLEEKQRRIEDLREAHDRLAENAGEALAVLPEIVDVDGATGSEDTGFDRGGGIRIEGVGGMSGSVGGRQAVEQVKRELNEGWNGKKEEGQE